VSEQGNPVLTVGTGGLGPAWGERESKLETVSEQWAIEMLGNDATPFRGSGHEDETVAEYNRRMDIGAPGLITNGRGVRSAGESLDRGTQRLAAMSFGPCLETGRFVETPDGKREPVMRPIQTEGELDRELTKRNLRRGTVNEANQRFEQMKGEQGKKREPVKREPSERLVRAIKERKETFRSQYDAGAIPKKEIHADIASRIPKSIKGV
jgi:hypothetical protein